MYFKVNFEKTDRVLPYDTQHTLNGVFYKILNNPQKYHDAFSYYSASGIQGAMADPKQGGIMFPDHPYFIVASPDKRHINGKWEFNEFLKDFVEGLMNSINNPEVNFFGLKVMTFETPRINVVDSLARPRFDLIRTRTPILLKKENWKIAYNDNPEEWVSILTENTKKKLAHEGIEDPTFAIKVEQPQRMKSRNVTVGNVRNHCTSGILTVYGKPETRAFLYTMGLGYSTGSGFGSVEIWNPKDV